MSFTDDFDKIVKTRFDEDIKKHVITMKHDDGLYKHYLCQRPNDCFEWFEIITWPGKLCISGDMGSFLFARTENMVNFMSDHIRSRSYIAEKCIAHENKIREFKKDIFYEQLDELIKDKQSNETTYEEMNEIQEKIDEIKESFSYYESEYDAEKAMYESELFSDELPDCKYFTYHFLWCLHAIEWFCDNHNKQTSNHLE